MSNDPRIENTHSSPVVNPRSGLVRLDSAGAMQTNLTLPPKEADSLEDGFSTPEEAQEGLFRPTELMCKVKARLHSRFAPTAKCTSLETMSKAEMIRLTGCSSISDWSKRVGFMSWLVNPVYEDEKLEWLYYLSYNALEDILLSDDPKSAGSRLAAAKLILEMKGKIGRTGLTTLADSGKTETAVKAMSTDDLLKIVNVSKAK